MSDEEDEPVDGGSRPPLDAAYRDPSRSVEERVEDLLARMTLVEKAAQLSSVWITADPASGEVAPSQFSFGRGDGLDPDRAMAHGIGQVTRPLGSRPVDPVEGVGVVNTIQRRLVDQTRLGIPAICHEECLAGLMAQGATAFPSPLNFAATWDPPLIERVADVIRRQMRSMGTHQGLAPVADVARDARWGRVEETLGEDPYLTGCFVTAYVRGLQGGDREGRDLRHGVVATLKHFAGYSGSEGGRNFAPTHVGRRELNDLYFVPFEMAVKSGGALSVMNSYQEIDGEAPAASRFLFTEVLRERWGFDGIVVADYGAVAFLYIFHGVAAGSTEAAALALAAGIDVELPNPDDYPPGIPDAVQRGLLDVSVVDRAVRRVLDLKFRLGLFEEPYPDVERIDLDSPDDRALAAEVARRSITLLANDGTLPLIDRTGGGIGADPSAVVAVIGPNAAEKLALFGNYSFENHVVSTHFPDRIDEVVTAPTVLDVLTDRLGEARVRHAKGCEVTGDDASGLDAAVDLAASADVAVVVVGDKAGHFKLGTVGEGTDATDLALPGLQARLVREVIATGTPTVLVLLNGRPFALGDLQPAAIVEAWFPGQDGAAAVVDVLLGDAEPMGRTTLSFTSGAGVQPWSYLQKRLSRGFPTVDDFDPVFPFGHGLTYTSFDYRDLEIPTEVPIDGEITVACTVENNGERDGDEVVQLYLRDPVASVTRPVLELKGFARVALEPGASARVTFTVPVDLCSFTDVALRRVVEPGRIDVRVGASSGDLRLKGSVEVVGEVRLVGEDRALFSRVEVGPGYS